MQGLLCLIQLRCAFATDGTPSTATRSAELTVDAGRVVIAKFVRWCERGGGRGVGQPVGGSVMLPWARVSYGGAVDHAEGYGRPGFEPEGVRNWRRHGATTVVQVSIRHDAQTCLAPSYFSEHGHFYFLAHRHLAGFSFTAGFLPAKN